jgi:hypothetical protein
VPDIAGRIDGAIDLVIVTEGNHFPALPGGRSSTLSRLGES